MRIYKHIYSQNSIYVKRDGREKRKTHQGKIAHIVSFGLLGFFTQERGDLLGPFTQERGNLPTLFTYERGDLLGPFTQERANLLTLFTYERGKLLGVFTQERGNLHKYI
jgi:hypothetical protein